MPRKKSKQNKSAQTQTADREKEIGALDVKTLRRVTKPFATFKKNAHGIDSSDSNDLQLHFLRGSWVDGTLKHYNSAVVKFRRFATLHKIDHTELLPASPLLIKRFVAWASVKEEEWARHDESVKSSTIKTYISGLKAWHIFHDEEYPYHTKTAVKLLIKASEMIEARFKEKDKKRPPVLLQDLLDLQKRTEGGQSKSQVAYTAALCAFWGTSRLGELVSDDPKRSIPTWGDLTWAHDKSYVRIAVHEAKTAAPGEIQWIHLQRQNSTLDPVQALYDLRVTRRHKPSDPLFRWERNGKLEVLTKRAAIDWFVSVWKKSKRVKKGVDLSGHSFRIGGASLRWNFGAARKELMQAGRWKSDTYKVYIRKYSAQVMRQTRAILRSSQIV